MNNKLARTATDQMIKVDPKTGYDLWASDYEGDNPNPVQSLSLEAITRLLPDLEGKWVLDVGAGRGKFSRLCLERGAARAVGLDFSKNMVFHSLRDLEEKKFCPIIGDARALPFPQAVFDVVISALMMGHNEQIGLLISNFASVLKPKGMLILSDFHPYATLRGWVRSFREKKTGEKYQIDQHLHLFEKYFQTMRSSGLVWDGLLEPKYEGFPVVFALRAVKADKT